ncbi:MAG TPA: GxxExxY protein [Gemmatimonadaceae bacterium]|nr:GxxExxY protein [Gemmatimonadaceae bacterium]
MLLEAPLTKRILRAFYEVHNERGYGFPEGVYSNALRVELELNGIRSKREVIQEVVYKGVAVGLCRFDLVVEERVLVEVKTGKAILEADKQQLRSYLKSSPFEVGLLLHVGPSPEFLRFIHTNDQK